mmetsp:Transcript_8581/g.18561  ORF Transcript_8581/g.18561 Transcript_8581/m.18561 type:complete len:172 (+) Transcript_8581:156-671(+)
MALMRWKKKGHSGGGGGCPKQPKKMNAEVSPEIIRASDDSDANETSFESLDSETSMIPATPYDNMTMEQYIEQGALDEQIIRGGDNNTETEKGTSSSSPGSNAKMGAPGNSCLGFSQILDRALTKAADVLFESMSCGGLDATCYDWMNVPGVATEGEQVFVGQRLNGTSMT